MIGLGSELNLLANSQEEHLHAAVSICSSRKSFGCYYSYGERLELSPIDRLYRRSSTTVTLFPLNELNRFASQKERTVVNDVRHIVMSDPSINVLDPKQSPLE